MQSWQLANGWRVVRATQGEGVGSWIKLSGFEVSSASGDCSVHGGRPNTIAAFTFCQAKHLV